MRVLITGGGTGGHTSPAIAIVEELRRRDPQLLLQWVGKRGSIEERVAKTHDIPFRSVPVEGWPRKRTLRRAWVLAKLAWSGLLAWRCLRSFQPQLVIGVGGYVSLPAAYIAQRLGIPVMLHEQNKRLGMANRLLAPRAAKMFLSYPDSIGPYPESRAMVVGNPVRAGFVEPPPAVEAKRRLELHDDVPVVLVIGGSQGARSINDAMAEAIQSFAPGEIQLLWMTGKSGAAAARDAASRSKADVRVYDFIDDMPAYASAADLIVSRAGASSTAEIAMLGKPSILIPYPHATDDHQTANAQAFVDAGAAVLLPDSECDAASLGDSIRDLLGQPDALAAMGASARGLAYPAATDSVVGAILAEVFPSATT